MDVMKLPMLLPGSQLSMLFVTAALCRTQAAASHHLLSLANPLAGQAAGTDAEEGGAAGDKE